jgi:hypothetical protein
VKLSIVGFLVGLAVGVSAMIVVPRLAGPYLPPALQSDTSVEGTVVAKQRQEDRVLLNLRTAEGSILVTFKKKISEIDLLVEQADRLTLGINQYQPFVEDPEILRVAKEDGPVADTAQEPEPVQEPR